MKTLVSLFLMTFSLTTLAEQATQQISLESFNEMASSNARSLRICKKVKLSQQQKEVIKEKVVEAKKAKNIAKAEMKNLVIDHVRVLRDQSSSLADAENTRNLIQEKAADNSKSFSNARLDILYNVLESKQRPTALRCLKAIMKKKSSRRSSK